VLPVLDGLMNETFFGKRVISGDDKALTLLVQSRGWKVRYQSSAHVYTPGSTEMRVFLKQRLRWARNSWRADLKALASQWVWRKPLLAVHLIDRLLQPLTTLVAPLYVGYAISQGHWSAVLAVITWWCISRTVKLWPNLRRKSSNITILPWYLAFNYWSAVMRIYAFYTMNQQGWITRWNQNRMALLGPMRLVPGYVATILTVLVVAFWLYGS
jgi:hyaluronan synthase